MGSGNLSSYMDRAGSGGLSRAGSGMLGRPGLAGYPLPIGPSAPRINARGYAPAPALHLRRALLHPCFPRCFLKSAAADFLIYKPLWKSWLLFCTRLQRHIIISITRLHQPEPETNLDCQLLCSAVSRPCKPSGEGVLNALHVM